MVTSPDQFAPTIRCIYADYVLRKFRGRVESLCVRPLEVTAPNWLHRTVWTHMIVAVGRFVKRIPCDESYEADVREYWIPDPGHQSMRPNNPRRARLQTSTPGNSPRSLVVPRLEIERATLFPVED